MDFDSSLMNIDPRKKDIARVDELLDLALEIINEKNIVDPIEPVLLGSIIPEIRGLQGLVRGGALRAPLAHLFAWKRDSVFPKGLALRKFEGGLDKQLRRMFPDDFPARGDDPEFYQDTSAIDLIDGEELFWDMIKPLRYNDPDAHKVIVAIINVISEQRGSPQTVVDAGMAFGVGTRKMKMYDRYPFNKSVVMNPPEPGKSINPNLPPNREGQELLERALAMAPTIGRIVGFDVLPVNLHDIELGSSETFLMSRRLRAPSQVEEFNSLLDEDDKANDIVLARAHIDATNFSSLEQLTEFLPEGKADVFVFSGLILQFPDDKLKEIFNIYLPLCNKNAIFIVNEWGNSTPNGLQIIRGAHWHEKGGFKTFIIDPFNLDVPPIEVCRYTNRQCEKMILTPAGSHILKTGNLPI